MRNAIGCCTAALRVDTEAAFPTDWAMTQNNLGLTQELLTGELRVKLPKGET